uniref:Phosphoribosylformylglycinamidine synthase n=1 Tax=Callorhinchus milii TaxID=7868 RepID=A0A4W3JTM2_CALMI
MCVYVCVSLYVSLSACVSVCVYTHLSLCVCAPQCTIHPKNAQSLHYTVYPAQYQMQGLLCVAEYMCISVCVSQCVSVCLTLSLSLRLNFSTAWSTNAVSICRSLGLPAIDRVECSRRYLIQLSEGACLSSGERTGMTARLYDQMTECVYAQPITSFSVSAQPVPVSEIDVVGTGKLALERANQQLGLAFDEWDVDFYTNLFQKIRRNPTSVECFDLAQSNSEHSRHWFFKGQLRVNGEEMKASLFDQIMKTQNHSNTNNIIKFSDNSSAIEGRSVTCLYPNNPTQASHYSQRHTTRHLVFTAETHNFPTGVAPFSGATTGTGGRIRDVQATGRGAHVIAGTAGYCFGNLLYPGKSEPWEDQEFPYPGNFARPLEIAIQASNGASDYGNKFGEPVLAGFARSFGMSLPTGERREWVKPIMFSGGIGTIEAEHVQKKTPELAMDVVKIGGPVYRIGVGGGAASSIQVQGDSSAELDFGAVQRGDPEMEQRMNRAVRACIETSRGNPICSIHDQGAGGNGNVLKELSMPAGAIIYTSKFQVGDPTLSVMEIWGAEYQESNALLSRAEDREFLRSVCEREKCPIDFVGKITGDGKIVLVDDREQAGAEGSGEPDTSPRCGETRHPVDLELDWVIGKMPQKKFVLNGMKPTLLPLTLPADLSVRDALSRVLRLPSVASKRYLTNKVDRSVTGLVAQQQCVGPLHTPLADVAVVALSHFDTVGGATALGEQPVKGMINPAAGARMAVAEALTNLVFARVTHLKDVKCSGNWMWPAKLPGEGTSLYEACQAMCQAMQELGVALDGGKDSLSMAARVGSQTVKAPGSLVISAYAVCPDITATVTPDLKNPEGKGYNLSLFVSHALEYCGLARLKTITEGWLNSDIIINIVNYNYVTVGLLWAGHDVSDGGLLVCLLEMAFAGNFGVNVDFSTEGESVLELLFAEELGLVLEVSAGDEERVRCQYMDVGLRCLTLGHTGAAGPSAMVCVTVDGQTIVEEPLSGLRNVWERPSFLLERLQTDVGSVEEEEAGLSQRLGPCYTLTRVCYTGDVSPRVAVIREEGSNGDREMAAALYMAGFEVWDVTMTDVCHGSITLDMFRGLVFVGGFSYADVLGSAKGWAATVLYNPRARAQFGSFRSRTDTFSLGVCNGCQLLALLGWVAPETEAEPSNGVLLTPNRSGRFESRFVSVSVLPSPSLMLRGMEGSTLGVWVAHGEGRMSFRSPDTLSRVLAGSLAPLRYADDKGSPTETYPLNPNGSELGIAGLCSADGRHLALMPHPERCVRLWQWAWVPPGWNRSHSVSPWLRVFLNASAWCCQSQST